MERKTYTKEEVQYFMENPREMIDLTEENGMLHLWYDFLYESPDMTVSEIVKDFFYHFELIEEETE